MREKTNFEEFLENYDQLGVEIDKINGQILKLDASLDELRESLKKAQIILSTF